MSHADNTALEHSVSAPRDVTVTVKMIGPVTQTTDLHIICLLQHTPVGDTYIATMQDFTATHGGVLSSLRERRECVDAAGETVDCTSRALRPGRRAVKWRMVVLCTRGISFRARSQA